MGIRSFCLTLCLAVLAPAAVAVQDIQPITKAVGDYLRTQTQGLPGKASFSVGSVNAANKLAPCADFTVGLPQGGRLWGKTSVVVRCVGENAWTLYVPVKVRVTGNYLVSSRSLKQGQVLAEQDIAIQSGDLTELPAGILTERLQVIGQSLTMSIAAGQPLRLDWLKQTFTVRQGQNVKVVSTGPGFEVANDGEALNNAAQGQLVRVRLGNGQLVNGIAQSNGTVKIAY